MEDQGKNSKTKWNEFNLFKVVEECKKIDCPEQSEGL